MLKAVLSILVLMMMLSGLPCFADTPASGITSVLEDAGMKNVAEVQIMGQTAACFAEKDSHKTLCILEQRNGDWQLVIANPTALIQTYDWPEILLDSDNAIFWTYTLSDEEVVRYHSTRAADGTWGPVDQYYVDSGFGAYLHEYTTNWDEAHGGEIIRVFAILDANENRAGDEIIQYLPASWLRDCIQLADFDVSRFPTMFVQTNDDYSYECDSFFREAAAAIMPDCIFLRGLLKDDAIHMLVQKPNGDRVYVICEYASRRKVNLIESSPLPADTVLGVENFTDSLWIDNRCVSIHLLNPNCAGIQTVYNDRPADGEDGILHFGDRTAWAMDEDVVLYGDHPWDDITTIDWKTLPRSLVQVSDQMDSDRYAYVFNQNPMDRLHLRERADRKSRSQGKYYNGTPVTILAEKGDWAQVMVGEQRGWMMRQYLISGDPAPDAMWLNTLAMPKLLMRGETIKVYQAPQSGPYRQHTSSTMLKIIGIIGNEWYHVWFPQTGEYGFVRQSDMMEGDG